LLGAAMRLRHRLIAALDVPDVDRAHAIARAVRDRTDAIKVNWPLVLPTGSAIVRELAADGYVLCDFKLADIPNTNRLVVEQAIYEAKDPATAAREIADEIHSVRPR